MAESKEAENRPARLDSWKEIGAYLGRDARTAQRWEKNEGLPVRRHVHGSQATVYALPEEIDSWLANREIDGPTEEDGRATSVNLPVTSDRGRRRAALRIAALTLVCGSGAWLAFRSPSDGPRQPMVRLDVDLGPKSVAGPTGAVALSPDGNRLIFLVRGSGIQQLATRLLNEPKEVPLNGTENARDPFFSPDGQWVGYFADGKLKKISVHGGAPSTLCDAPDERGGSWGKDGNIIVALNSTSGLSRVPSAGGNPQLLTNPSKTNDLTHRWPQLLRGDELVLFTANTIGTGAFEEEGTIKILSLKSGEVKTLVRGGYFGRYLPVAGDRGLLAYVRRGTLYGVSFNLRTMEAAGSTSPLLDDVAGDLQQGAGKFDFSSNGTFVYASSESPKQTWPLVWFDARGNTSPVLKEPGAYYTPRLSPDGRFLALAHKNDEGTDLYVHDLLGQSSTRITFGSENNYEPVWTPDGRHIAFSSSPAGMNYIGWTRSDGGGEVVRLLENSQAIVPFSFSPDGARLAYFSMGSGTGYDIWSVPLDLSNPEHPRAGMPEAFLQTGATEFHPMFSPDGRWLAYVSDETGSREVYVKRFPLKPGREEQKWQISTTGGYFPRWSRTGHQLFYETLRNEMMMVDYESSGTLFKAQAPKPWGTTRLFGPGRSHADVSSDGRLLGFQAPKDGETESAVRVTFLIHFFDELARRQVGK